MKTIILLIGCLFLLFESTASAAEEVTLTTYYPAPFGSYDELTTEGDTHLGTDAASKIGIGTTNPAAKLEINQGSGQPALRVAKTGGNEPVAVLQGGNVGIGTTSPDLELEVSKNSSSILITSPDSYAFALQNSSQVNSNFSLMAFKDADGGSYSGGMGLRFTDHGNDYGDLLFITRGAGGYLERMTVDEDGNVGIGNTSPSSNPPNGQGSGNLDVNDVFLRSINRWSSQLTTQIVIGPQSNNNGFSQANCPAGMVVTGGGFAVTGTQNGDKYVRDNRPTNTGTGWLARLARGRVRAYAVCVQ